MPPNSRYTFEICVESAESLSAAAGIADRIELCTGLDLGGLTPDAGLMARAAALGVETHVLIRGRAGDFRMGDEDLAAALEAIAAVRRAGLKGVVIGAEKDGRLDLATLAKMVGAAAGLDLTLHRVVDIVEDPLAALAQAVELGFHRVLTSGGAPASPQGVAGLARLHDAARGRIEIMAGGGLSSANLAALMDAVPVTSFHASCTRPDPLDARYAAFGFGHHRRVFDPAEARRMADLLRAG